MSHVIPQLVESRRLDGLLEEDAAVRTQDPVALGEGGRHSNVVQNVESYDDVEAAGRIVELLSGGDREMRAVSKVGTFGARLRHGDVLGGDVEAMHLEACVCGPDGDIAPAATEIEQAPGTVPVERE